MKRLLWYLNQIPDSGTTTFRYTVNEDGVSVQKEIYDGECQVVHLKPGGEVLNPDHIDIRREPVYWHNGISFTFERTNRMAVSRPTVIIAIPTEILGIATFTPAAADYCLRQIKPFFDRVNGEYANKARPDHDNGKFFLYEPGGEVLVRNAAYFAMRPAKDFTEGKRNIIYVREFVEQAPDSMCLCIRMEIQLPHGKLKRAKKMLTADLPEETERFVTEFTREAAGQTPKRNGAFPAEDSSSMRGGFFQALALEEKQTEIRKALAQRGLCAFIADGSILAREKGTRLPMKNALPFKSTPEDEVEIAGVRGMGIKQGVTVITGGGYSGKSTVLNAISAGIYNHAQGDGRELCITDGSAVTITAEDGRAVSSLNISPFIKWLPSGSTMEFSTAHASGSTSQAANIMEAVESGAGLLLIDEDRSATNFMIRDALMKLLIRKEPITPFTDRVRELGSNGVSTVLVIGGSGEYLSVADKVYMMEEFRIADVTERAQKLAKINRSGGELSPATQYPAGNSNDSHEQTASVPPADWSARRMLNAGGFTSYPEGSGTERLEVTDTGFIILGDERIDIRALHDTATAAQVDGLAFMLRFLAKSFGGENDELEQMALAMRGLTRQTSSRRPTDIDAAISKLYGQIEKEGCDAVNTGFFTGMNRFIDLPRRFELRAAVNRMRKAGFVIKP